MPRKPGPGTSPTVAVVLPALLAAAAQAGGLTEQVRTYDMTVELENEDLVMVRRTSWTRVEEDGHDAWRVSIEHDSDGLESSVDTIHVAADDLRPLRRYIKQGDMRIRLHYTSGAVRGRVWLADGSEMPIQASLDAPIVGDIPSAIAEAPLAPGYVATFTAFDPTLIAVRRWKIATGAVEVLETRLGSIETYPIELSDANAPGRSALYWVTRDAPHHVVKSESELPPSFGGGRETVTITSVSPLPPAAAGGR